MRDFIPGTKALIDALGLRLQELSDEYDGTEEDAYFQIMLNHAVGLQMSLAFLQDLQADKADNPYDAMTDTPDLEVEVDDNTDCRTFMPPSFRSLLKAEDTV